MLRALVKERQLFRNILKPGFTFIYLHVHKIYQVYCILYIVCQKVLAIIIHNNTENNVLLRKLFQSDFCV